MVGVIRGSSVSGLCSGSGDAGLSRGPLIGSVDNVVPFCLDEGDLMQIRGRVSFLRSPPGKGEGVFWRGTWEGRERVRVYYAEGPA